MRPLTSEFMRPVRSCSSRIVMTETPASGPPFSRLLHVHSAQQHAIPVYGHNKRTTQRLNPIKCQAVEQLLQKCDFVFMDETSERYARAESLANADRLNDLCTCSKHRVIPARGGSIRTTRTASNCCAAECHLHMHLTMKVILKRNTNHEIASKTQIRCLL